MPTGSVVLLFYSTDMLQFVRAGTRISDAGKILKISSAKYLIWL